MASVGIYLNFNGTAEAAMIHYKQVFNTEFSHELCRMGDLPKEEGMPELSAEDKQKVMHVALMLPGGVELMASDTVEAFCQPTTFGTNVTISLTPDTKEELHRLYEALADGGSNLMEPHDEFWGYWGCCTDKFGVNWMFNIPKE